MKLFDTRTIQRGFDRIRGAPQLWLTVFLAIVIFGSFVYVANRFTTIARDAQDRLVNVRVGSLQDAFAPLAAIFMDDPARLRAYMQDIATRNPTIVEFLVVTKISDKWIVKVALDPQQAGTFSGYDFLLSLATADPSNSFTVEEVARGERFFRTARGISDSAGAVTTVLLTRQTLSEADRQIASSIKSSFGILVVILLILFVLFFHHARIIDYTELYRRLKEVDQLKDDFVSMVSHELRSPLTIIRGYVAMLREKGLGNESAPEFLKRIDDAAQAQNLLIGDILDVARIEQGKLSYTIKNFNPLSVVKSVAEGLTPAAVAKSISISCDMPPNAMITADEDRLRQILTNLISNSIKYSDKGQIVIKGEEVGNNFVVRVSDNGIGMSAEEQKQLFGKFRRMPGDRVRKEVGTGLGLWITKQLVEGMGGAISVESIKGVGSHFIVSFPLSIGHS